MKRLTILTLPIVIFSAGLTGFLVWFTYTQLFSELATTLKAVIYAGGFVAIFFFLVALLFGSMILWEHWQQAQLATDERRIKNRRETFVITLADPGQQVYLSDILSNLTTPLHLQAGQVNGHRSEPWTIDIDNYRLNQMAHATAKPAMLQAPEQQPAQLLEAGPLPLLPILLKAQRLIIGGGSDSGKSTLAKHLIAGRAEDSQIVVIDPHSPSKVLGFDVIGAGRDYGAIGQALESLELLMHERYSDVAKGLMGYFQHNRISIFIDEWTGIVEKVPEAGKRLKTLLTESRKVNMFLCVLTHSTTLDGLGLPSAQLKKSAMIVELVGGQGQPHKAFIHPGATIAGDGKKARPTECSLPGPFTGYLPPKEKVLLALPDPKIIKVQQMADEGKSEFAMIQEFFGVEKPSRYHYTQIRELLARAQAAKKARLDNVEGT